MARLSVRITLLGLFFLLTLPALGCKTLNTIARFADDPVGATVETAVEAVVSRAMIRESCAEVEGIAKKIKYLADEHGDDWVIDVVILANIMQTADRIYKKITYLVREGGLGTCIAAVSDFRRVRDTISNMYKLLSRDVENLTIGDLRLTITLEFR